MKIPIYFFTSSWFVFSFSQWCLSKARIFHFDEIQFINFIRSCIGEVCNDLCLNQSHKDLLFSCRSFIALGFTFRSMIHFDFLRLVVGLGQVNFFCTRIVNRSSTICWKDSIKVPLDLCWCTYVCMNLFGDSLPIFTVNALDYYSLIEHLKSGSTSLPILFFLACALATPGPLNFHMNFRISFWLYPKLCCGFYQNCIESKG